MIRTSPTYTISIDGNTYAGDFTIAREKIDVTKASRTVPDMTWEYTDQAGHYHAWAGGARLPTLDTLVRHFDCTDDCDGHDIAVHRCAICHEEIQPRSRYIRSQAREYMPGREDWSVRIPAALEVGQRVSVVVRVTDQLTAFGHGLVSDQKWSQEGVWSTVVGSGLLGWRSPGYDEVST